MMISSGYDPLHRVTSHGQAMFAAAPAAAQAAYPALAATPAVALDPIARLSPSTLASTSKTTGNSSTSDRPTHLAQESLISPWTREGIIRYWAYVNDVTAAFAKVIGTRGIIAGNIFSLLYSVIDTVVVGRRVNQINRRQPEAQRKKHVRDHVIEAAIFQLTASVIAPYVVIDGIRRLAEKGLDKGLKKEVPFLMKLPPFAKRYLPVALSLSAIPFTAPVVDKTFHWIMNNTIREWMHLPKLYHKKHAQQNIKAYVEDSFDAFEW